MTPERWRRIEALVGAAVEIPVGQRPSFLHLECGDDGTLRSEVELVLASYDQVDTFLEPVSSVEHPAAAPLAASLFAAAGFDFGSGEKPMTSTPRPLEEGARVGKYRLRRRLGRGGMGDVFLAERADDTFRSQVAIKVVHRGVISEGVLRRFKSERQILASLDHPNIARLLDGGSTDDGRPYLVMELVEGIPIDAYCDQSRLGVAERLQLFQKVCGALQYAHQNLVVHRDIKPSNILVTCGGVPKLLDFGIAKLLNPELFPYTAELTRTELRPMTPQYASPEQLLGQPITTASDVYSLGVLLYKLLTGRLPRFASGFALGEAERRLSTEEPSRPSTAVGAAKGVGESKARQDLEEIAKCRGTLPRQLRRQLAGDLDNIVLMALRKEPHRRYGSVEGLADDLQRHLEGLPVRARPDTLGYRLRKLAGRNWLAVTLGSVAIVLLLAFAGAVVHQAQRIRHERDLVSLERDKAERVANFMVELFEVADPGESRGNSITVREVLDHGADKIMQELSEQPEVQATLLMTLSRVYGSLGLLGRAQPLLDEALVLQREIHGERSLEVAESMLLLAQHRATVGRFDEGLQLAEQSFEIRQSILGPTHPELIGSLLILVGIYRIWGDLASSQRYLEQAVQLAENSDTLTVEQSANALFGLASLSYQSGELERAEVFAARLVELVRSAEQVDPRFLALDLHLLGVIRRDLGKLQEAEAALLESLEVQRQTWPGEPVGIQTLVALSRVYRLRGKLQAALEQVEACDRGWRRWQERAVVQSHEQISLMTMCKVERVEVATALGDSAAATTAIAEGMALIAEVDPQGVSAYGKETWVRVHLLAGDVATVRPVAETLLAEGWQNFDFVALCRRHGIEVSPP